MFVQTRAVRTAVAVGLTVSSTFAVYLLARAVAALGGGAAIAELVLLCVWFAGVAGLGFAGAAAVARDRRLAPGLWAWSAGLAGGAAVFLALVLFGRPRATEPSPFATATLALGLAAFACIAGLSLFQMRGTLRADRAAGCGRRRPPEPPDTLPGTPLYR